MITVRGFTKCYGDFEAVHDLNLQVEEGDIFGIIGPNGAGKTTTFRFLTTLLLPTQGRATVAGHDVVREVREVRRSIGYMPDHFGVYFGGSLPLKQLQQFRGLQRDRNGKVLEIVELRPLPLIAKACDDRLKELDRIALDLHPSLR